MPQPTRFLAGDADVLALQQAITGIALAGYCESSITTRLALDDITALNWRHTPIYRAGHRTPLDLAIDLLLLQGTLSADELKSLPQADALLKSGLLELDANGNTRAKASLFPVGTNLILSDHAWPELDAHQPCPFDHVMAIGLDSRHLAHCTVRKPIQAALDLCTGSGIHALLAAAHADRVLAVDINPRAIETTRLNSQISNKTNLEAMEGDLYAPAAGQQFDLITANPPFVPSPVHAVQFRDGGPSGEDIQRRIVEGLPHHLAPGGIAQMVTELGERDGEPLTLRLREWLGDAPIDIHVLRLASFAATQYAVGHSQGDDHQTFLTSVRAWSDNLRAQRYTKVHSVIISFQWTAGPPWEREDHCPAPRQYAGAEIESIFAAERLARRPNLREYLEGKWLQRSGPIARFDARILGSDTAPTATATRLGQTLKIEYPLDDYERQILDALERPVSTSELFRLGQAHDAPIEATLRSLIRKRLITIP